ncbi:MAG: hypothetical protein OEM26_18515 [Saprospiraceae bacterium]|nr:hypothetical protein [Saprospiraceae bacterium]
MVLLPVAVILVYRFHYDLSLGENLATLLGKTLDASELLKDMVAVLKLLKVTLLNEDDDSSVFST